MAPDSTADIFNPVRNNASPARIAEKNQFSHKNSAIVSYGQTLELYRTNAKKSSDPQTQLDFAYYLLEASTVAPEDGPNSRSTLEAEGLKWVKKLATQSPGFGRPPFAEAQFFLAECYGKGALGLEVDHDKAFSYYVQASKQNHAVGTYRVSVCYELGAGTKKDSGRAAQFYRKAAVLGDPLGMHKLGLVLLHGTLGQNKNPREAITWLKRAAALADEKHPEALHDLAVCYEKDGCSAVIPDEVYALELFTKAANYGYASSQFKLGSCFEYGLLGCPIDPVKAIEWHSKAAEQDDPEGELALSGWYLTGVEGVVRQSDSEAYLWARKAADRSFAKAEYAVGYYSETGVGVKPDVEEAKRWYARAAGQGNKRAAQRLSELKKLSKTASTSSLSGANSIANANGVQTSRKSAKKEQGECRIS